MASGRILANAPGTLSGDSSTLQNMLFRLTSEAGSALQAMRHTPALLIMVLELASLSKTWQYFRSCLLTSPCAGLKILKPYFQSMMTAADPGRSGLSKAADAPRTCTSGGTPRLDKTMERFWPRSTRDKHTFGTWTCRRNLIQRVETWRSCWLPGMATRKLAWSQQSVHLFFTRCPDR